MISCHAQSDIVLIGLSLNLTVKNAFAFMIYMTIVCVRILELQGFLSGRKANV